MKEVYERLLSEIHRLRGKLNQVDLEQVFTEYIYDRLTDDEVLQIIKSDNIKSIELPTGLKHQAVLKRTLQTIDALQQSTSWLTFQEPSKQPPKEQIDFDELINHILKQKPSN